ncbi:hypothetical protein J5X75_40930 [Actinoplanes sp. NEAU-H7]|uniref:Uncharacterized protein n=2 Tax=Actinoplanes flavus TaxID=2820290 RepID=A0ABS3UZ78_9ACTN|nr:hypothetical protein [Actinoplanes flavus]
MCVSVDQAEFTGTILYAGRCRHPEHGLVEVLGYQNTAVNLADGPNAMLLHLPVGRMSPRNFISVGHSADILIRMRDVVIHAQPVARSAGIAWMGAAAAVEVFDHDIYTVVLASDPTQIPAALRQVPPHKRPPLNRELFEFYADAFPGYTIALCCFDNAEAQRAKPLLMWYPPTDPDRLVLPALDCHTGGVPDLRSLVRPDHWVLLASDAAPEGWGTSVEYPAGIRHKLRRFLPDRVTGVEFSHDLLPNGDFAIAHDDLLREDLSKIERVVPGH